MRAVPMALLVLLALPPFACGDGPVDPACDEKEPYCDPGYVCVRDRLWPSVLPERRVCKKTEALGLDAKCVDSAECKGFEARTAACADQHRTCPTGKEQACDLRCRPVCNNHDECGPDKICWPGGGDITGVCQEGECGETAVDCAPGLQCFWFKSGPSGGYCFAPCDLLRQQDCNLSPPPGDARCCAPQQSCLHFAAEPSNATCVPVGQGVLAQNCDTEEGQGLPSCQEGLFCSDIISGTGTGTCLQYCNRFGGQPACDRPGAVCLELPAGTGLPWGYCN